MARGNRNQAARTNDESPQQEEMTVVVMKFKGSSTSLQKGFDAVSQAISALGSQGAVTHRLNGQRSPNQLPAGPNGADPETEEETVLADNGEAEGLTIEGADAPSSGKGNRKERPSRQYTFMNDFNLEPDGVPSLKTYCAERSPQTIDDKFLIAGAWIQKHGGVDPFTGTHLFTCFRALDWKTQADMTQPLRRMKSDKSYFDNPSTGKWKLTVIGLSAAESFGKA